MIVDALTLCVHFEQPSRGLRWVLDPFPAEDDGLRSGFFIQDSLKCIAHLSQHIKKVMLAFLKIETKERCLLFSHYKITTRLLDRRGLLLVGSYDSFRLTLYRRCRFWEVSAALQFAVMFAQAFGDGCLPCAPWLV